MSIIRLPTKAILLVLLLVTVLAGCGRGGAPKSDLHAFDKAPDALKQMWADASAAVKANDFVAAQNKLRLLASQDLSEQQRTLVDNTMYAMSERLTAAVKNKDPNAIKALGEIRRNRGNQSPTN